MDHAQVMSLPEQSVPSRTEADGSPGPQPETLRAKARRWRRSLKAMPSFSKLLLSWGVPFAIILLALLLLNGFIIGWWNSFDVLTGTISPVNSRSPALALVLAITGWLLVPAVVGALAGYAVNRRISGWRDQKIEDINSELAAIRDREARNP